MADKKIYNDTQTEGTFTITVASLAAWSGRQSTMLDNTSGKWPAAIVGIQLKAGTAPTVGQAYRIHLIRDTGSIADDNAGSSDAAITIEQAPVLGTITLKATANKTYYRNFDTGLLGVLGRTWGIAIVNMSGQALDSTAGNHKCTYSYYGPYVEE